MSEIPGLDNLHHAESAIRFDQERIASIYGADACLFSVNGSTAGIIAAICAACGEDEPVIMARNCHISAFNGLVFSGARPIYIYPDETPFGLYGGINPGHLKHMMEINPECHAVFITSPTYEGFVSDIKTISEYVHDRGGLLIVDEAHGAHFPFHNIFPEPAIRLGADIVITSPHKTLPALTQAALVLIKGRGADMERMKFFMRACQTSSPSYIIMSVIDYIYNFICQNEELFNSYAGTLLSARKDLAGLTSFGLVGEEILNTASVYALDLSKILFICKGQLTGTELERRLAEEYKVQLEMSAEHFALALTSAADTGKGFGRLIKGMKDIDTASTYDADKMPGHINGSFHCAQTCMTPRQALFSKYEQTVLTDSAGRISADFICAYPPGIPILAPGELISPDIADELSRMNISRVKTIMDL